MRQNPWSRALLSDQGGCQSMTLLEQNPRAGKATWAEIDAINTTIIADSPMFCSGFGQYHTDKNGNDFVTITLDEIRNLVDNPQQVDKTQAQWLIPSTLMSRVFKEQEDKGKYWLLWADIDENPKPINELALVVGKLNCDFEIYNSSSATESNQKARVLIPTNKPLCFIDWHFCQEILNDLLESEGIKPDRASERAAQLCYLPNRGEFYQSLSKRHGNFFDPLACWSEQIKSKQEEIKRQENELKKTAEAAKTRGEALKAHTDINSLPDLISVFNEAYSVPDILLNAGYKQRGNTFCHPRSESGSYSASIKDGRVYSLSTADPLYSDGAGAHDAFSAFCVLFHNGDQNAALKDAGDNLMINGESWNKVQRREWAEKDDKPFSLAQFSLNGKSKDMEQKMLEDKFVLGRLAILGQATVFYAQPNTGKTLLTIWLLIQAIKLGEIKGENVFYINADDNHKGLVEKIKLAEKYHFHMLAPDHNDFESKKFLQYIDTMIKENTASGVVIILDTLKKFTDLMDKKLSSEFMRVARAFVSKGGTLIMLAHTNKRRDENKRVIYGGTSDIVDDSDCAYTLDELSSDPLNRVKKVKFENIKSRGDVEHEAVYCYSTVKGNDSYEALLESIQKQGEEEMKAALELKKIQDKLEKNELGIEAITEAIHSGVTQKTELIEKARKESGLSEVKIRNILKEHEGENYLEGHRWYLETGDRNVKNYKLLCEWTYPKN